MDIIQLKEIIIEKKIVTTLIIFLISFLVLQSAQSVKKIPITRSLNEFPSNIGGWKLQKKEVLSKSIVEMLGVDDYISYNYVSENGEFANIYLSYFGSVGVTGGYHSPLNCMPGGGTKILNIETVMLKDKQKIKRLTLGMKNKINYAYYWYYNRGRIIHSEYMEKIFLVIDGVLKGRRDGSFIRIIIYENEKNTNKTDDNMGFINEVSILLKDYIPGEKI